MTYTIQQAVDIILKEVPEKLPAGTVDTFKAGDPAQPLAGIATTFIATRAVIEKAASLGANLIIAHEPLFYNHEDKVDWLAEDPVYQSKRRLLEETRMAVWRFHDGWHTVRPDGVLEGLLRLLDWKSYQDPEREYLLHLPPTPLDELAAFLKVRLAASSLRVVGADQAVCRKAVVLPGFSWGEMQLELLRKAGADVVICGETPEWSTIEYMRDAGLGGLAKGVIILGHQVSEEPGMAYLAEWLRPRLPGVSITHIAADYALRPV